MGGRKDRWENGGLKEPVFRSELHILHLFVIINNTDIVQQGISIIYIWETWNLRPTCFKLLILIYTLIHSCINLYSIRFSYTPFHSLIHYWWNPCTQLTFFEHYSFTKLAYFLNYSHSKLDQKNNENLNSFEKINKSDFTVFVSVLCILSKPIYNSQATNQCLSSFILKHYYLYIKHPKNTDILDQNQAYRRKF